MNVFRWTAVAIIALCSGCGDSEQITYEVCPIPLDDAPTRGADTPWVTIVEFADFQCSFCREAEATIKEIDTQRPGLRWAFKHFPLTSIHAYAESAASAADCAHQQGKFWPMHDRLFANETERLDGATLAQYASEVGLDLDAWTKCYRSDASLLRVLTDIQQGSAYGVDGTPTFFVNGYVLHGLYPTADFLRVIDEATADAKSSGVARASYYEDLVKNGCSD
ncbi:MAG: DsbA family protein [Polyangiaceae bacterium]